MTKLVNKYLKILKSDGVIITSTDTVPAIICNALSEKAVKKIYKIKKRHENKPLAILCPNKEMAKKFLKIDKNNEIILDNFAPGAITLILPAIANNNMAKSINLLNKTIGLRIPDHNFLHEVMSQGDFPLAATSANISNESIDLDNINSNFDSKVQLINLGKDALVKQASSIFTISSKTEITEHRKGPISKNDIKILLNNNKNAN